MIKIMEIRLKNNRTSGESFVQEETIESTDNIDNTDNADGSSAPTPELKTPRTKRNWKMRLVQ